jgi:hypothetical protein
MNNYVRQLPYFECSALQDAQTRGKLSKIYLYEKYKKISRAPMNAPSPPYLIIVIGIKRTPIRLDNQRILNAHTHEAGFELLASEEAVGGLGCPLFEHPLEFLWPEVRSLC